VRSKFKPKDAPSETLCQPRGSIVYFLGAGASKSICSQLPLAADLTLDSLSKPESYGNQIPPTYDECRALTQFIDSNPKCAAFRGERLESVLEKLRKESREHYELVLDFLYLRLSVETHAYEPYSSFAKWLRVVREKRDTIITTNYDTLVECTLMHMGTGEFLPMDALDRDALHWLDFGVHKSRIHKYTDGRQWLTPPEESVLLLKLHGSISWLFCEHCGTYLLDPGWQHAREGSKLPSGYGPCAECKQAGAPRRTVIVPPLAEKDYSDAAIQEIWARAKEVLGRAEETIFVGFSLDKADVGVRHLLKEALGQGSTGRVTIVDWNSSGVEKNYREVYGNLVHVAPERDWKQFLERSFSTE
jgi:NAD-dependent SIR2 family protein deacetylase